LLTVTTGVISSGDLYCYLLPRCEALRTCRSGFPIATQDKSSNLKSPPTYHSKLEACEADLNRDFYSIRETTPSNKIWRVWLWNIPGRAKEQRCREYLKKLQKQQAAFTKQSALQNIVAEARCSVAYNLARNNKSFLLNSACWIVQAYCALKRKADSHISLSKRLWCGAYT